MTEFADAEAYSSFLARAAVEVLGAYGVRLRTSDDTQPPLLRETDVVAILGFSGPDIAGALVLAIAPEVLERSLPVASVAPADARFLHEWAGELANQALGRLKDRFVQHGGELLVGTPRTFTFGELPFGMLDPARTVGHALVGVDAHAYTWFEAHTSDAFRLSGDARGDATTAGGRELLTTSAARRCVLIAEDATPMRLYVDAALRQAGFDTECVADGREALARLVGGGRFHAAVFDVHMPHLGGLDVVEQLRQLGACPELPIVMLTAEAGAEFVDRARLLGVRHWFVKPIKASVVAATLRSIVGS